MVIPEARFINFSGREIAMNMQAKPLWAGVFWAAMTATAVAQGVTAGVGAASNGPVVAPPTGQEASGLVNFDGAAAPCLFQDTTRLTALGGAAFSGTGGPTNGGAVLDACSNFGVTGYSAPNFLAFNCSTTMADGGIPKLPEIIRLPAASDAVSLSVGDAASAGKTLKIAGLGPQGIQVLSVTIGSAMQTVRFTKPVKTIILLPGRSDPICTLVVDNLNF